MCVFKVCSLTNTSSHQEHTPNDDQDADEQAAGLRDPANYQLHFFFPFLIDI